MNFVDPSTLKSGDYVELCIPMFYHKSDTNHDCIINAIVLNKPLPYNVVYFLLDCPIESDDSKFTDSVCSDSITVCPNSIKNAYKKFSNSDNSQKNCIWYVDYEQINIDGNTEEDFSCLNITKKLNKNKDTEKTMTTKPKLNATQIFAQDATKASIRSGATLGINGLKTGLKKLLLSKGISSVEIKIIMKFLEEPIGEAMLRAALGYGLLYLPIPMVQENEYAQKVSEELRVSGMSKGIDEGLNLVQQFIIPSILESFQGTPLLENLLQSNNGVKQRVSESISDQVVLKRIVTEEVNESEEVKTIPVKSTRAKRAKVASKET